MGDVNLEILATLEELGVVPGVSGRRGIKPEVVEEKLKLSDKDYTDRLLALKKKGFVNVATGWVASITPKGQDELSNLRSQKNS